MSMWESVSVSQCDCQCKQAHPGTSLVGFSWLSVGVLVSFEYELVSVLCMNMSGVSVSVTVIVSVRVHVSMSSSECVSVSVVMNVSMHESLSVTFIICNTPVRYMHVKFLLRPLESFSTVLPGKFLEDAVQESHLDLGVSGSVSLGFSVNVCVIIKFRVCLFKCECQYGYDCQ